MLVEHTFEVTGEDKAAEQCRANGWTLVRISPLPVPHEQRHLVQGRFYALATSESDEGLPHVPHMQDHAPLAVPSVCPGRGCGVLLDGEVPHTPACEWWNKHIESLNG